MRTIAQLQLPFQSLSFTAQARGLPEVMEQPGRYS